MIFLNKEKCSHCLKSLCLGQKYFECFKCNCIIHEKCFKISEASVINLNYFCSQCKALILKQYNPFKDMISKSDNNNSDPLILKMSQVLEYCKPYWAYFKTGSTWRKFQKCFYQSDFGNFRMFELYTLKICNIGDINLLYHAKKAHSIIDTETILKSVLYFITSLD